ncbi:MAG: hypothetical protein RR606_02720 [Oscillospiraceae bacterium]
MKNSGKQLPSKSTMNLMMKEKSTYSPGRVFWGLAVVILLSLVVGKFAVADRIGDIYDRQTALAEVVAENGRMAEEAADYEKIYEQYSQFSSGWMTEEEKALYSRVDILAILEGQLMEAGQVSRFSLAGNVLSVDFTNTSLGTASDLMSKLKEFPEVVGVELYTANNQANQGESISLSMTITFQSQSPVGKGGEGQ